MPNELDKEIQAILETNRTENNQGLGNAIDESRVDEILENETISESDMAELEEILERVPATTAYDIRERAGLPQPTASEEELAQQQEAQDGGTKRKQTDGTEQAEVTGQQPVTETTTEQTGSQADRGATEEGVTVEEKHVPFFKTGKLLRDRLNGKAYRLCVLFACLY